MFATNALLNIASIVGYIVDAFICPMQVVNSLFDDFQTDLCTCYSTDTVPDLTFNVNAMMFLHAALGKLMS